VAIRPKQAHKKGLQTEICKPLKFNGAPGRIHRQAQNKFESSKADFANAQPPAYGFVNQDSKNSKTL
jgi:hypothetical protein